MRLEMTQQKLIFFISVFFVLLGNLQFYAEVLKVYPPSGWNIIYIVSVSVVLGAFINLLLNLVAFRYTIKPLIITILLVGSFTNYFMSTYHVIIDDSMIRNSLQTDIHESLDLLSWRLAVFVLFLGVLPSVIVYKTHIVYRGLKQEIWAKFKSIGLSLVLVFAMLLGFSKFYTSFFREHKVLRFYTNPTYWIYSIGYYVKGTYFSTQHTLKLIGLDAKIDPKTKKRLVIMVVGEAARADHFSLNGYDRETTPKLKTQDIVNFSKMYSCGTSTAHSVPCMFSIYTQKEYSYEKALYTQNVLDVLDHTNEVAVLWRDNNSDSKGVATRVMYENFKTSQNNQVCDEECRDIGMLEGGLETFIEEHYDKHILIVLHQMGNHGPAYYKRYTQEYEKFTPVCQTNQLEECSKESINNAYDNALLYTDMFLDATIEFAKRYGDRDVAVLYMSDHGESLGEGGVYLHGLPYFIAPDAQKHIGAFLWFNENFKKDIDLHKVLAKKDKFLSHDYLFHTLLGLFEVKTQVYDPKLDILK